MGLGYIGACIYNKCVYKFAYIDTWIYIKIYIYIYEYTYTALNENMHIYLQSIKIVSEFPHCLTSPPITARFESTDWHD
jgi:hypothetical protein